MDLQPRKRITEWVEQKISAKLAGLSVAVWDLERIRPEMQSGMVKEPDLKGHAALLAHDGVMLHVLHLGEIEFHGTGGSPTLYEPFQNALLEDRLPVEKHVRLAKAEVRMRGGVVDCGALLGSKGPMHVGNMSAEEFDSLADLSTAMSRADALTPGCLAVACMRDEVERARIALEAQIDNRPFHAEFFKSVLELDDTVMRRVLETLEHGSAGVRAQYAKLLSEHITKLGRVSRAMPAGIAMPSAVLAAAGVAFLMLDDAGEMLIMAFAGAAGLLVALFFRMAIQREDLLERHMRALALSGDVESLPPAGEKARPRTIVSLAVAAAVVALGARPLLLRLHEHNQESGVRTAGPQFERVRFQPAGGWTRLGDREREQLRMEISTTGAALMVQYERVANTEFEVTQVDGHEHEQSGAKIVFYVLEFPAPIVDFEREVLAPETEKLDWGVKRGDVKEIIERSTDWRGPSVVARTHLAFSSGQEVAFASAWYATHPQQVVIAALGYDPRRLQRASARKVMRELEFVPERSK